MFQERRESDGLKNCAQGAGEEQLVGQGRFGQDPLESVAHVLGRDELQGRILAALIPNGNRGNQPKHFTMFRGH